MLCNTGVSLVPASEYLKFFWDSWKAYPKYTHNILYGIYQYQPQIDLARFKIAAQKLVDVSYNLRTNLIMHEGQLYLKINHQKDVEIECYQIQTETEWRILAGNCVSKAFNLSNDNLYRFIVIDDLKKNESQLIIMFHHCILDGTQFDKTIRLLSTLYNNNKANNLENEDIKSLQSYHLYEKEQISQGSTTFWINKLKDFPAIRYFPFVNGNLDVVKNKTASIDFKLSIDETKKIITFLNEKKYSIFDFIKIIWATLLARYCMKTHSIIFYPVSTRTKRYSALNGSFMNVLFYTLNTNLSLIEALNDETSQKNLYKLNKFVSLEKIFKEAQKMIFGLELRKTHKAVIAQTDLRRVAPYLNDKQKNVSVTLTPNIGNAVIHLEYQFISEELIFQINYLSPFISYNFAQQCLLHFKNLLLNSILNSNNTLDTISLLKTTLNCSLNVMKKSLINLFQEQVQQNMTKAAIITNDSTLNYFFVETESNKLAEYFAVQVRLTLSNSSKDSPIFIIYLEKKEDILLAMIAALKVGGCYIILNPRNPTLKLSEAVKKLNANFIISSKQYYNLVKIYLKGTPGETTSIISIDEITTKMDNTINNFILAKTHPSDVAHISLKVSVSNEIIFKKYSHQDIIEFILTVCQGSSTVYSEEQAESFYQSDLDGFSIWDIWSTILTGSTLHVNQNFHEKLEFYQFSEA